MNTKQKRPGLQRSSLDFGHSKGVLGGVVFLERSYLDFSACLGDAHGRFSFACLALTIYLGFNQIKFYREPSIAVIRVHL